MWPRTKHFNGIQRYDQIANLKKKTKKHFQAKNYI